MTSTHESIGGRDDLEPEDIGVNTSAAPDIQAVISRRLLLAGGEAAAAAASATVDDAQAQASVARGASTLAFKEVPHGMDGTHHVAPRC